MCKGSADGTRQTRKDSDYQARKDSEYSEADKAAGPAQHFVSLSESGCLSKVCCVAPASMLLSLLILLSVSGYYSSSAFYVVTFLLTMFTLSYSTNLSVSCILGVFKMRAACRENWDSKLEQLQENDPVSSEIKHIIVLPNYKEDERMLQHTLENLGRSPIASHSMYVVLAMEEREGQNGKSKAERLMENMSHLFADMMAAYHPDGLAGELAGKSSNTQWGFKAAMQRWDQTLAKYDPSKVILTVGDADTLWHPQFFSALSCNALSLSPEERAWSIWQPPILLVRNLFSVPGPTRLSAYATCMFELAGLANQYFGTGIAFSAYSLSLALASNSFVHGWDRDVIAEDHHMFCKCYFASLWESVHCKRECVPKLQLRPIFLPAISYLVESSDGWIASVYAKYLQARRHAQGVAEISYVFLQYVRLIGQTGITGLPFTTHAKILGIASKMINVHIVNQVQALAIVFAILSFIYGALAWIYQTDITLLLQTVADVGYYNTAYSALGGLDGVLKYVLAILGPIPPLGLVMTIASWLVVVDVIEGRITQESDKSQDVELVEQDIHRPKALMLRSGESTLGFRRRLNLFVQVQNDYFSMAHFTLLTYGLLPSCRAAFSLMCFGHRFEYIVAAKPV